MYQSHWNTSDYTRISTCPCYCRNVVPLTSRFQNLVSTADSQWGPVPCFVKKKLLVKSSQVSDVMSSSESLQWRSTQLFCPVKCFVASVINRGRFYSVIGDFTKPFFSVKMFLFKFTIKTVALCYREEVHNQTITAKWSQRSGLRLAKKSVPELPLPAM